MQAQPTWKPNARQLKAATELARQCPIPLDRLPYTPEFDYLHTALTAQAGPLDKAQSWHCLLSVRKRGLLSRHKESAQ